MIRVGLIGDHNPEVPAHIAIPRAIALAAQALECDAGAIWLPTPSLENDTEQLLPDYNALWCVPASPYRTMEAAPRAIRFAREHSIPFLASCRGSQHPVIDYTQTILALDPSHPPQSNPNTY